VATAGSGVGADSSVAPRGVGIVIIEAAAVGTPSIGFKVPGVRDAIIDGETGFLVDSEEDLAKRWIQLSEDGDLRERQSEAGRTHAAGFGWRASSASSNPSPFVRSKLAGALVDDDIRYRSWGL